MISSGVHERLCAYLKTLMRLLPSEVLAVESGIIQTLVRGSFAKDCIEEVNKVSPEVLSCCCRCQR